MILKEKGMKKQDYMNAHDLALVTGAISILKGGHFYGDRSDQKDRRERFFTVLNELKALQNDLNQQVKIELQVKIGG